MYLLDEANRCLICKKPRCKENCPIRTAIPEIITFYKEGNINKAGEVLFKNNPLSLICSIVCPHENQCFGNCIKGIKGEAIKFYDIEKEISAKYLENIKFEEGIKTKDNIAIIGGGPAGITIAFILASHGYKVTIFEANERIGGVLRYGIPEYRLPKKIIDKYEEKLVEIGVKIRPNTLIGPVITIDRLFEEGYKAIFIGTGVWNPRTLNIKGETLGNVHFAIDYLKSPSVYRLGDNVGIIGAGNVAMDAARTAKKNGVKDVTIIYRGTFDDMSATKKEVDEAKSEGVEFKLLSQPKEIMEDGIRLIKTKKIDDFNFSEIDGSDEFLKVDSVIVAISQLPKNNIVLNTAKLETSKKGLLIVDDNGHTTRDGIFSSGDVVTGAKTVVEAVAHAKIVAKSIEEYCNRN